MGELPLGLIMTPSCRFVKASQNLRSKGNEKATTRPARDYVRSSLAAAVISLSDCQDAVVCPVSFAVSFGCCPFRPNHPTWSIRLPDSVSSRIPLVQSSTLREFAPPKPVICVSSNTLSRPSCHRSRPLDVIDDLLLCSAPFPILTLVGSNCQAPSNNDGTSCDSHRATYQTKALGKRAARAALGPPSLLPRSNLGSCSQTLFHS